MDVDRLIDALRDEGRRLAEAAEGQSLDVAVPTCPDWSLRDLVRHIGGVHRWAATFVVEGREEPTDEAAEKAIMETWPDGDDALVGWFRDGHAALVEALSNAPDDLSCWTFLAAPTPRAFWARRQAHETAIHRADAQSPTGSIAPSDADLAADGVDELLFRFMARRRRLDLDRVWSVGLDAPDAGRRWRVTLGPDGFSATSPGADGGVGMPPAEQADEPQDPDCLVTAPTSDLYHLVWNRRDAGGLDVRGSSEVLDLWREHARVVWG
jgi:uncharacterized protein (TIGR03083 family)